MNRVRWIPVCAILSGMPVVSRADTPPTAQAEPATQTPPAQTTPQAPQTPSLRHDPIGSAIADRDLTVRAQVVAAEKLATLVFHYRHAGEAQYRTAPFARESDGWAAVVPAAEMIPGVIEYYIGSTGLSGSETLHFASPSDPHPMIVVGESEQRWRRELLAFHYGNRSRFQGAFEWVDFGGRTVLVDDSGNKIDIRDHYWRLEGDYTYRILAWIYSIRLGVGLIRGDTYNVGFDMMGQKQFLQVKDPVGLTYGFAEVRFRLSRIARLDLRTTLGAGPLHFDGGVGGTLIIGAEPGTHFAVGVDGVTSVGTRGFLRLGWNTVPRVPMSFTIEVTNLPFNGNVGGRVFLSAGYRFSRYFSANAYLGYATRDFRIGGPGVGLNTQFEF